MAGKTYETFSLDLERDKDILTWLKRQEKGQKSAAIRKAIRDHIGRHSVTVGDVLQAVRDLERRVKAGGVVVHGEPQRDVDEPADVAAALDALADL